MAPSKDSSCKSHLPLRPSTPVQVVVEMMHKLSLGYQNHDRNEEDGDGSFIEGEDVLDENESEQGTEGDARVEGIRAEGTAVVDKEHSDEPSGLIRDGNITTATGNNNLDPVREAITKLSNCQLGALYSGQTFTSDVQLELNANHPITPMAAPDILAIIPDTLHERLLLAALRESTAHGEFLQKRLVQLQAANILNKTYCARLKSQLAH